MGGWVKTPVLKFNFSFKPPLAQSWRHFSVMLLTLQYVIQNTRLFVIVSAAPYSIQHYHTFTPYMELTQRISQCINYLNEERLFWKTLEDKYSSSAQYWLFYREWLFVQTPIESSKLKIVSENVYVIGWVCCV